MQIEASRLIGAGKESESCQPTARIMVDGMLAQKRSMWGIQTGI